jgi:hypothetical protein
MPVDTFWLGVSHKKDVEEAIAAATKQKNK